MKIKILDGGNYNHLKDKWITPQKKFILFPRLVKDVHLNRSSYLVWLEWVEYDQSYKEFVTK